LDYIRAQAKPPDKFSHQLRLYQLAKRLAEGQPYDDDVLYAAAWMHDLGVFIGRRPEDPAALAAWDHIAYAARQVPPLLKQFGFPEAKIAAALKPFGPIRPRPRRPHLKARRDADILEQSAGPSSARSVKSPRHPPVRIPMRFGCDDVANARAARSRPARPLQRL
jgi:uncharacterized protein